MVRKILTFPDPILSTVCDPCGDDDVSAICNDMMDTARAHKATCAGLSANQIGYTAASSLSKTAPRSTSTSTRSSLRRTVFRRRRKDASPIPVERAA